MAFKTRFFHALLGLLCALLPPMASAELDPACIGANPYVLKAPFFEIALPAKPPSTRFRAQATLIDERIEFQKTKRDTLWGTVTEAEYIAQCGADLLIIIREWTPDRSTPLSAKKLSDVRAQFLKNRGCFANTLNEPALSIAIEGKKPPQTVFSGNCKSPDDYTVLTAIIYGKIYQINVSYAGLARPSKSQAILKALLPTWSFSPQKR